MIAFESSTVSHRRRIRLKKAKDKQWCGVRLPAPIRRLLLLSVCVCVCVCVPVCVCVCVCVCVGPSPSSWPQWAALHSFATTCSKPFLLLPSLPSLLPSPFTTTPVSWPLRPPSPPCHLPLPSLLPPPPPPPLNNCSCHIQFRCCQHAYPIGRTTSA